MPELTIELENAELKPEEVWASRAVWQKEEEDALNRWAAMSAEDRERAVEAVKQSMSRAIDRVEDWLPSSIAVDVDNYLRFTYTTVFTDVVFEEDDK